MAIQTINIGNIVNDGLGDDLRTAFQKVNGNFASLAAELTITASNLGSVGVGIFKQKSGVNLEFKSLVSSGKIELTETPDSIIIRNTQDEAFYQILGDSGRVRASPARTSVTLQGGPDITVNADDNTGVVTVNTDWSLTDIFSNLDFGYISSNVFDNTVQYNTALSNSDFGTFTSPSAISANLGLF